jgi:type IV pilus assembly protein PilW
MHGEIWAYYVGASPDGPPALYQRRMQITPASTKAEAVSEELAEAVDTMQILYGRDTDNDNAVDDYVTADGITDWNRVLSVRIGLLVRSPDTAAGETDTQVYNVNGTSFNPVDDRRVREVFTTTVAIRNRLP